MNFSGRANGLLFSTMELNWEDSRLLLNKKFNFMASVIDVRTLSKNEIIHLVKDLMAYKLITREILTEVTEISNVDDTEFVEALINKHFNEYDEVFRKLA